MPGELDGSFWCSRKSTIVIIGGGRKFVGLRSRHSGCGGGNVDSRYMLWVMESVDDAEHLIEEMVLTE